MSGTVASIIERFSEVDARLLLPALLLQVANLGLRSLAWRNVLAAAYPDRRVPYFSVAGAYTAGVGLNNVAPGRMGEFLKPVLVRTRIRGSTVAAIAGSLTVVLAFDALVGGALVTSIGASGFAPHAPRLPVPMIALIPVFPAMAALAVLGRRRLRALLARALEGTIVLRTPTRWARSVASLQLAAWACRFGVVLLILAAFHIRPSFTSAALVLVAGGLSTAVPVPGGGGAQQVLVAYALQSTASVGEAVSFSLGMQFGVAAVNTLVGLTALMLMIGTLRPAVAVRTGLALARDRRSLA